MKELSILILSYDGSKHLSDSIASLIDSLPLGLDYEILLDREVTRTGLANVPNRYQDLFLRAKGKYILTTGDDFIYFKGWYRYCKEVLDCNINIPYVCFYSHVILRNRYGHLDYSKLPCEPITNKAYGTHEVHHVAGPWLFRRGLWEQYPFNNCCGATLDTNFANYIYKKLGQRPHYINDVLAYHMGFDRKGGVDK